MPAPGGPVGDHRVIYEVVDGQLVILVVGVGHRRKIYRGSAMTASDA